MRYIGTCVDLFHTFVRSIDRLDMDIWNVSHTHSPTNNHTPYTPTIRFLFFSFSDRPEPHILLFRRPLGTDPQSGAVVPELLAAAREEYKHQFGLRK